MVLAAALAVASDGLSGLGIALTMPNPKPTGQRKDKRALPADAAEAKDVRLRWRGGVCCLIGVNNGARRQRRSEAAVIGPLLVSRG